MPGGAMLVQIGLVVMASGRGERFGADKLMADFCGKPLVACAMDAIPEGIARATVVTRSERVAELARARDLPVILHALPDISDTVRLGIRAMAGMDGCFFLVADQPALRRATLERMMAAFCEDPTRIVRAAFGGAPGNPVLFPAALFDELARLSPSEGGAQVARRHAALIRSVEAGDARELADVDTPEALKALAADVHGRGSA